LKPFSVEALPQLQLRPPQKQRSPRRQEQSVKARKRKRRTRAARPRRAVPPKPSQRKRRPPLRHLCKSLLKSSVRLQSVKP
jgi:hypothetical protein